MKQIKRIGIIALNFFVLVFFIPKDGKSTTQIAGSCPQKFIATVTNIEDVEAGSFPKVEVSFLIIQNLYGDQISSKKIKVVKDGPVQFKNGEIYTVELNENWLCSATLFTKI